ncbi:hypothetical protein Ngar_c02960 [Candidatus Nitrososphaera gargensis Ga9.2]|uniref:Uncharacterized protein n=1 Tax=Nitrososphaera gargensis (strain Ga9.2) TaxID=1237085 RepID=K0ILQ8_NITGG|nr:hypothetical protein [Candidatus Nitrososphaera gargensis]AFU57244.1 hypothetical protein Ngar_c02960 [Candidatus Nitrososphaera gargensis Ga9.2]
MSKQLLLNEIERLYIEGIEPKENLRDELYVKKNYPHLDSLFAQYRSENEKWEQLVREVLFYDKQDITYMYNRTMLLVRRFGQATTDYFRSSSPTGTYILPDRLSDLNRMFELYHEFFSDIYPGIINELNFGIYAHERISNEISGVINWNKTILYSLERGTARVPIEFATSVPKPDFETPENQLLIISILRMRYDATFLLTYPFSEELSLQEKEILTRISTGCSKILKNTILHELIPKSSNIFC